jgi:type VI secretion system protein ImpI
MTLRLSIENLDRLPDGGPLRIQVQGRGLDIGRDQHLDWTLPDPTRHISGKHCEIRFRDGGYWIHDVSTNGTFVNGGQFRLNGPHLLRNGDRLSIGQYIIAAEVEGQDAGLRQEESEGRLAGAGDPWSVAENVAAPEERRDYLPRAQRPAGPDFLDYAADVPSPGNGFETDLASEEDWLRGPAAQPSAAAAQPVTPTPRRRSAVQESSPPSPLPLKGTSDPPETAPESDAWAILMRIARASGIPEEALKGRDAAAVADEMGAVLGVTARNLAQLLASRSETKSVMRTADRTMIQAAENNPLKFLATAEEAMAIMFGAPTRSYLRAPAAVERSFADLKAHQVQTFGAIQAALDKFFQDFAPEKIEKSTPAEQGLSSLVVSRKARLWDAYVERWRATTKRSDGRLGEAFMALLAESYDQLRQRGS